MLERAPDDDQQLVDLERLLQVVERAELHRLDRALDAWRARSSSGSAAARPRASTPTSSRIRSRPLSSGIRLSTTSTSKGRSASSRCASRGAASSRPRRGRASRSARPSALRIFSSSSTRRMEPRWASSASGCSGGGGRMRGQLDADLGAAPGRARHRDRAAQALDDVLGDRQAEAGAAALGREVRIEDARQVRRRDADAAVARSTMRDAVAVRRGRRQSIDAAPAARAVGARRTAWRALTSRLTSADAQPLGVGRRRGGSAGSRSSAIGARPADACAAAADSRQSALRSAGASSKRIGRAKSSTSLTMRLSRVDLLVDVGDRFARSSPAPASALAQRVQRRLDDHQRVADFVRDDRRQPAERRQPLLLRHLALEARDRVGQRVERRRQQPRVLVVPAVAAGAARSCASGRRWPPPRASRR